MADVFLTTRWSVVRAAAGEDSAARNMCCWDGETVEESYLAVALSPLVPL